MSDGSEQQRFALRNVIVTSATAITVSILLDYYSMLSISSVLVLSCALVWIGGLIEFRKPQFKVRDLFFLQAVAAVTLTLRAATELSVAPAVGVSTLAVFATWYFVDLTALIGEGICWLVDRVSELFSQRRAQAMDIDQE
jgi:hypothetical protein